MEQARAFWNAPGASVTKLLAHVARELPCWACFPDVPLWLPCEFVGVVYDLRGRRRFGIQDECAAAHLDSQR